jgi:tetratricopeptide (TPR) repeat protein
MFVENKKFQEALALTEKILEKNRNNVQAIITKAHILSELRRSEDVIDTLKAKIKNNPHWAEGYNLLGLAWMRTNEYDKALLSLNSSIELKETPENLTNLGITLSKLGRDDDAVNVLTRCIKTHPSYTKAYVNLGTLFNATNRPTNALKTLRWD